MLKEKILPNPISHIINPKIQTINTLSILTFSSIQAVKGSHNEIEELKAAIDKRTKNNTENIFPKGKE